MDTPRINNSEYRFCEILWENEPVSSSRLVELCKERLEWKKSTTYTIIKRLSERGVLKSENSIVTSLVSRKEAQRAESISVIDRSFHGSLPGFVATFVDSRRLTDREIEEIRAILDNCRMEKDD